MYAKLNFLGGTKPMEKVRDIVRIIVASNGGTANLNDLEYINVNNSKLIAGKNSGWAHVTGQTLGTGSATYTQDGKYYLQCNTVDGKTKTVIITFPGTISSSTVYNNTNGLVNPLLSTVGDYGESQEQIFGYSSSNTTHSHLMSHGIAGDIEIFATPRKLVLVGANQAYNTVIDGPKWQGSFEWKTNGWTKYHDLTAHCYLSTNWWSLSKNYATSGMSTNQTYTYAKDCESGYWNNTSYNYYPIPYIAFPYGSHYDYYQSRKPWFSHFRIWNQNVGFYSLMCKSVGDNGTDGGTRSYQNDNYAYFTNDWNNHMTFGRGFTNYYTPGPGHNASEAVGTGGGRQGMSRQSDGTKILPMTPWQIEMSSWRSGVLDFSSTCGVYKGSRDMGVSGDEITINGKKYKLFGNSNSSPWMMEID